MVLFRTTQTKRAAGKALCPRRLPATERPCHWRSGPRPPKALRSTSTSRRPRTKSFGGGHGNRLYHLVAQTGAAVPHPRRVRACEIRELPATLSATAGTSSHCTPSNTTQHFAVGRAQVQPQGNGVGTPRHGPADRARAVPGFASGPARTARALASTARSRRSTPRLTRYR